LEKRGLIFSIQKKTYNWSYHPQDHLFESEKENPNLSNLRWPLRGVPRWLWRRGSFNGCGAMGPRLAGLTFEGPVLRSIFFLVLFESTSSSSSSFADGMSLNKSSLPALSSFKSCLTNTSVYRFLFFASTHFLFLVANCFFSMAAHVSSSPSSSISSSLLTVNFRQPRVLVIHWFRLWFTTNPPLGILMI
jgi:hypothetical protein